MKFQERKDNRKLKRISLSVVAVIIIIAIITGVIIAINKAKENYTVEEISSEDINYYKIISDGKSGVIDKDGKVIIEPEYNTIKIPNPKEAIFICIYDYNAASGEYKTKVLNEKNEEILTNYENVNTIDIKEIVSSIPYEKTVLQYQKNGKYGIIDFNGKEYYEDMLKAGVGTDMSVKEVKEYLQNKMLEIYQEMTTLIQENPDLANITNLNDVKYSDFTSVSETLDYLKTAINTDFPKIDNLNYEIITVPDAWKDNFSPAAYLQGKIDAPIDTPELIYINGEYSQSLFGTIEHEGYPGHMYQHTYFKQQKNIPTVRYLIDYNGYSEGWATYVEWNGYKYAPVEDKDVLHLLSLNDKFTSIVIGLMDIGIHYDGWTYEDYKNYWKENFNIDDEEVMLEQYNLFIETPTNYLQYYLSGFLFEDLYNNASKELGDKFSAVDFHEVILSTGPAPFKILEKQVNKYINSNK